jgi:hypothetical protein
LAEFRDWIKKEYVTKKMPSYLLGKVKQGQIAAPAANIALNVQPEDTPSVKNQAAAFLVNDTASAGVS